MPKIIFTVVPPEDAKLAELAESTYTAFAVLLPWCTSPPANPGSIAVRSIVTQAKKYVRAIDHSIVAAQDGFNIAEEAINLATLFQDVPPTDDEYTEYLLGMVDMASRGQQNAKEAVDGFRTVRATIEGLIRDARDEQISSGNEDLDFCYSDGSDLNRLEGNIDKLEQFSNSVSEYIKWWNFMQMTGEAQRARSEQLVFRYDPLRERAVVNKWIELRKEYVHYQEKISLLQDKYREYKWLSTWRIPSAVDEPKNKDQSKEDNASAAKGGSDVPVEAAEGIPQGEIGKEGSPPNLETNHRGEREGVNPGSTPSFGQAESAAEETIRTYHGISEHEEVTRQEEGVEQETIETDKEISEHGEETRQEEAVELQQETIETDTETSEHEEETRQEEAVEQETIQTDAEISEHEEETRQEEQETIQTDEEISECESRQEAAEQEAIQKDQRISEHKEENRQNEVHLEERFRHEDMARLEGEPAETLWLEKQQTDEPETQLRDDHSDFGTVNLDELEEIIVEDYTQRNETMPKGTEAVIEQRSETMEEEGKRGVEKVEVRRLDGNDTQQAKIKEMTKNDEKQSSGCCGQCVMM